MSATVVHTRILSLPTHAPIELLDITERVAAVVREARIVDGFVQVFVRHTTAAVRIQEDEPLLLDDLRRFLAGLAPADADYGHNDFRVRNASHASRRAAERPLALPPAAPGQQRVCADQ